MLSLEGVRKDFQGVPALVDVDLVAPRGRTTALIGPSGCGKSTALRLLLALIEPDAGAVRFDGAVLEGARVEAARLRTGYVIQSGGLFPHMTARENATLMARHLGWDPAQVRAREDELLRLTGLDAALLGRHPQELSGGQRQRVGLMRALFLDPDVLLLDEPLGALDPMIRSDLQQDLARIFRELQKTVVLVTHDLGEAAFLGDEIVLMRRGRIVQQGTPSDLLERPASDFVRAFVNAQWRGLGAGAEGGS